MKSMILLPVAVGFALTGCASERLQVAVVDNMGNPVSEAQQMRPEDFKTNTVFYCYPSTARTSSRNEH